MHEHIFNLASFPHASTISRRQQEVLYYNVSYLDQLLLNMAFQVAALDTGVARAASAQGMYGRQARAHGRGVRQTGCDAAAHQGLHGADQTPKGSPPSPAAAPLRRDKPHTQTPRLATVVHCVSARQADQEGHAERFAAAYQASQLRQDNEEGAAGGIQAVGRGGRTSVATLRELQVRNDTVTPFWHQYCVLVKVRWD